MNSEERTGRRVQLEKHTESGLGVSDICREEQIKVSQFCRGHRRSHGKNGG